MDRKFLIGLVLTLVIIVFIAVYWATEPGRQRQSQARQTAEAVERGAKLYTATCAVCHGQAGEGKIGPALNNTRLDGEALEKTIGRGRPRTPMPAWGEEDGGPLKKHQIKDLVVFIENWHHATAGGEGLVPTPIGVPATTSSSTSPAAPSPTLALTSALESAAEGRRLFLAQGCIGCHKIDGQGGEIGPSMVGLFGSERELATGEKVTAEREYLEQSIRDPGVRVVKGYPAGVMPKFSLSQEQMEALVDFIKTLAK